MITGAQIRLGRELLGWAQTRLAQRAKVHSAIVKRAESVDGEPPITVYQEALIRNTLERFGNFLGEHSALCLRGAAREPRVYARASPLNT